MNRYSIGYAIQYVLAAVVTVVESVPWKRARSVTSALSTQRQHLLKVPAEANILHLTALGINDRHRQEGKKKCEEREAADRET